MKLNNIVIEYIYYCCFIFILSTFEVSFIIIKTISICYYKNWLLFNIQLIQTNFNIYILILIVS